MSQEELTPQQPVAPIDYTKDLSCPLLGLFGEDDQSPTPEQVNQLMVDCFNWPVGPFAILDSRAEAMHGDLEMLRGDREAAEQHFRRAWQIIGPIVEQWDRSRDVLAGEHLRQLRQRLLPYVSQR